MKNYVFDFGDNADEVTLCVEVQAESKTGAVAALHTYLEDHFCADGPYVIPINDPSGNVQEFRFYFRRQTSDITEEQIYDEYEPADGKVAL